MEIDGAEGRDPHRGHRPRPLAEEGDGARQRLRRRAGRDPELGADVARAGADRADELGAAGLDAADNGALAQAAVTSTRVSL
jgi:hypothetical protein